MRAIDPVYGSRERIPRAGDCLTMQEIDDTWRAAHPLPEPEDGTDKNSRGRVVVAGGARFVPGAIRLTGEAALRAGAGKLRLATVADAAMHLGVLVPEASMLALPSTEAGEIAPAAIPTLVGAYETCDALVLGPGTSDVEAFRPIVEAIMARPVDGTSVVLDAAAIRCGGGGADAIRAHGGRVVLTPHAGEMAALRSCAPEIVARDPAAIAREAAAHLGAVVVLKGGETLVAGPDGTLLHYRGGGIGLATGGSGDVLAGILGGLLARGADPLVAAGWAVWAHGETGRRLAADMAPIGYIARDLLPLVPGLLHRGV
jgi:hydroxyethylthiazole kinase-like uncharacterized protein yjeF